MPMIANAKSAREEWALEELQEEADDLRKRLTRFRKSLGRFFVHKQDLIDLMLVAAIAQERGTGKVLMMAWMTEATLRKTLESGRMVYWSRTRQEEWAKGDTSGDRQWVRQVRYDCDGDTLLFVVEQEGRGACHTGERTRFYRAFGGPYEPRAFGHGAPAE